MWLIPDRHRMSCASIPIYLLSQLTILSSTFYASGCKRPPFLFLPFSALSRSPASEVCVPGIWSSFTHVSAMASLSAYCSEIYAKHPPAGKLDCCTSRHAYQQRGGGCWLQSVVRVGGDGVQASKEPEEPTRRPTRQTTLWSIRVVARPIRQLAPVAHININSLLPPTERALALDISGSIISGLSIYLALDFSGDRLMPGVLDVARPTLWAIYGRWPR